MSSRCAHARNGNISASPMVVPLLELIRFPPRGTPLRAG
ncbi:hypothetical protein RSAG8_06563, partial [Rhizoctonia solani AG-8 WAC10335]